MAKKKTGTLLVGCAAVVVLGIAYAGVVKYNSYVEEKEAEESEAARIYMTNLEAVTSIQYGDGADALLFKKEDDTWQYAEDEEFSVKQTKLETLENYLTQLEATRKFSEPDELDGYGLSEPSEVICFTDSDGEEYTLSIGSQTDTSEYYAMISGDDSVYTISTTVPNAISHELYDFLQMDTLPSLTSSTIETITLTVDGEERYWNKEVVEVPETEEETTEGSLENETGNTTEETNGKIDEPEIATAEGETEEETTAEPETTEVWFANDEQLDEEVSSQIDEIAAAIAALDFVDCANYKGADNLEEYGLDEPQAVISWTGDDESATLYIGDEAEEDGTTYYYVRLDGSNMVNRIEASLVEAVLQAEVGE